MASPALSSPPLMGVQQFKHLTDNGWRRDSKLKHVDQALMTAKFLEGDSFRFKKALIALVDECRVWLDAKQIKFYGKTESQSYGKRKFVINQLMTQAMLLLKELTFAERKAKGQKTGLADLKQGFSRERDEFRALKATGARTDPHSSSYVVAGRADIQNDIHDISGWDPEVNRLVVVPVAMLTEAEFIKLSSELTAHLGVDLRPGMCLPRVHFVRKQERINSNMLISLPSPPSSSGHRRNLLYKDSSFHPYSSSGPGARNLQDPTKWDVHGPLDIYAIDKYGNLMVAPNEERFGQGQDTSEYRHSSLNAGNDVICAGRIKVISGEVQYMDNWSGHYKPSERDLARGVMCLCRGYDLDLSRTKITLYFSGAPQIRTFPQLVSQVPASYFAGV